MYIMHCRKYHLHNCNRDSNLYNFNKNFHPHIRCRNFHLHKCCRNFLLHNCNRNSRLHNCNRKIHHHNWSRNPANIYLFQVNNRNIRKRCEICLKLTIKTPDIVLVVLLSTLNIFHTFFRCFYCWLWTNKC